MHGSTNKSPIKLNAIENKFDTGDLFTNGENHRDKTPPGDSKVTTPENPLLSKQTIISKGISIPYTNLQLNPYPIPNWTYSIVTISHSLHGSQYMTNQLRGSEYAASITN